MQVADVISRVQDSLLIKLCHPTYFVLTQKYVKVLVRYFSAQLVTQTQLSLVQPSFIFQEQRLVQTKQNKILPLSCSPKQKKNKKLKPS
jgi:hypothetical protein